MLKELGKEYDEKEYPDNTYSTPGTLCIWKWLSYERYLPGALGDSKDTDHLPQDDGNATGPQTVRRDFRHDSFLTAFQGL
jgi:hypothetical protein